MYRTSFACVDLVISRIVPVRAFCQLGNGFQRIIKVRSVAGLVNGYRFRARLSQA